MRTWRRLGTALLAALIGTAGLTAVAASPAAASGPYTSNILSAVNSQRAAHGLRPYVLRSDLSSVAYGWSRHMASTSSLSHNPGLTTQITNWRWVGENVGYGPDWSTVMAAFMASPAHRANILDHDFTEIGIGVVVAGGRVWITQDFRQPMSSSSSSSSGTTTTRHRTVTRPRTTTRTTTPTVSRPAPARHVSPAAPPHPVVAAPSPEQLLVLRIRATSAHLKVPPGDPVAAALGFSAAMSSVAS